MTTLRQLTSDDDCKQCLALDLPIEIIDSQTNETVYKGALVSYDDIYFYVQDNRFERDKRKYIAVLSLNED